MWLDGICYPAPGAKLKRIYKFAYVHIWSKVCDFGLGFKFAHTFARMLSRFFVLFHSFIETQSPEEQENTLSFIGKLPREAN
jgi:hypothetical protein